MWPSIKAELSRTPKIGHGLLEARRVSVVAERRDGSSRAAEVYLPDVDGAVVPVAPAEARPVDELAARRQRAA